MPTARTADLMSAAYANGTAVGAFNVICLEHAEAIVAGAEAARLPVILQVSENTVAYHGGLVPISLACIALAETAAVPVAVHLDHATSEDLCLRAIDMGYSSVMFDSATLPYADNVRATAALTARAHALGAFVEAELGIVGGKDGGGRDGWGDAHAPDARTDPGEAAAFVNATDVDSLAVAVGTSHAMVSRDARVDLDLVAQIRAALPVPIVMHGSSGVSDELLRDAVHAGMTKVNIATQLNKTMTKRVREELARDPAVVDPRRYLGPARDAIADEVCRLLDILALASSVESAAPRQPMPGAAGVAQLELR
ncbi:MAG TPA: class II fructose-bisphosphate aldolase [Micromonosporaceae bacterium]|jgi:fructose-bisphosphate aldolase class II|nr:class II fructose-bisphosphate aldolase [Micromonosporaceae bacterium]